MRNSIVRKHVILAALLVLCVACQSGGSPQAHSSPKTTVAPTVTPDAQRCARLAKLGFTPCPPLASKLPVPGTTIKNATGGAINDATAEEWGRAFQITEGYYRWAMDANDRDALTSGALADLDAVPSLFGYDLRDLDQAKALGGTLTDQWGGIAKVQIVVVPDDLQAAMRNQHLQPARYAIAATFVGPVKRSIRLPNGEERVLTSADSSFQAQVLIWGERLDSQDLGVIWYEHGLYGCDGVVTHVCNP